jgi:hypothetical protein
MKHLFPFLLSIWLVAAHSAGAQPTPPAPYTPAQNGRLELALEEYSAEVEVQPMLQDSSVLLLVKQDEPGIRNDTYALQKYNHRLQPVWNNKLDLVGEFEFQQFCAEGAMAYALFQSSYVEHRLMVAAVDGSTGRVRTVQFDTKLTRDIYDLKALAGNLFVTVLVDNHLTILLLNLTTGKHQFLPSVYEPLPAQLSFLADSAAQRAEFVLSQSNGFKNRLQLKHLSAGGALLTSEFVQAESERGLIAAQISPATDSAQGRLLAGTYTLRDPRYSQGLFAADLSAGVTPSGARRSLRFYDYANLKHFFDFMSPNRARRLRQRSERMRAADRVLRLRYRTLMHDLLPFEDGYVMVAEVYFPHYRYNTYSPSLVYTPFYSPYDRSGWGNRNRNFDGYRVTHALICGFDKRGNLLWDNTLVMKNVELRTLTETVRLRRLPDGRLAAAYLQNDKLYYKVIDRAAPSPNDLSVNLATSALPSAREKATNTTQEGLLTWYGNRLLAYGFQRVRAERGPDRNVFFLNTISFE